MYGYIYKTLNLINNKIYIGQKKSSRFLGDKYLGSGKRLKEAVNKYGSDSFKVFLLEEIQEEDKMDEREIYWISFYNSTNKDIGYNLSKGGNVNRTLVGENNGFYGKHHSEDTRQHLKDIWYKTHYPEPLKEETKRKISEANRGKIVSKETREKLSINAQNNPNYGMRGKHMSEEAKQKSREKRVGKHTKARGRIYITNDVKELRIDVFELDDYLSKGWHRGRKKFSKEACKNISLGHKGQKTHNKGKICINKNSKNKFIYPSELELFLALGWSLGKIQKTNRKGNWNGKRNNNSSKTQW